MKNMGYEQTGVLTEKDFQYPPPWALKKGVAIIECIQQIPCNPCVDACPVHAITMAKLTDLPKIDYTKCTGCTKCVGICPGLAVFVVKINSKATVTLPYELYPIPKTGETVITLDREGKEIGTGKILKVKQVDRCNLLTIEVKKELGMNMRNIRIK